MSVRPFTHWFRRRCSHCAKLAYTEVAMAAGELPAPLQRKLEGEPWTCPRCHKTNNADTLALFDLTPPVAHILCPRCGGRLPRCACNPPKAKEK